ncbi:MAG: SagB/ThcOx family dehydrogenase [Defluviitaleaceae bacterium]|nr:SagB/ThcOx family dehydrogenase [Defluviitaleaceae bacterium]
MNNNENLQNTITNNRNFMKCPEFSEAMSKSDQEKNLPHPPHGKKTQSPLIDLHPFTERAHNPIHEDSYSNLLDLRRSVRAYDKNAQLTQSQLAFILHSAQGIQEYRGQNEAFTLRPVPSGGARHPFETYIAVRNVDGLPQGLYYYAPTANIGSKKVSIEFLKTLRNPDEQITKMLVGQKWAATAQAVLFLSCVPYRSEWRYSEHSHRVILIDLGHVGQNIMLSAASLRLGSCCMAAYDQAVCDEVLGLDGTNEYTVYAIAIGKPQ